MGADAIGVHDQKPLSGHREREAAQRWQHHPDNSSVCHEVLAAPELPQFAFDIADASIDQSMLGKIDRRNRNCRSSGAGQGAMTQPQSLVGQQSRCSAECVASSTCCQGGCRAVAESVDYRDSAALTMPVDLPGVAVGRLARIGPARRRHTYRCRSHLRQATVVPARSLVSSNSSISRWTPGKPLPSPPPVLKPSPSAAAMSSMPGPRSRLSIWMPARAAHRPRRQIDLAPRRVAHEIGGELRNCQANHFDDPRA